MSSSSTVERAVESSDTHSRVIFLLEPPNKTAKFVYAIVEWEDGTQTRGRHSEKKGVLQLEWGLRCDGTNGCVHALRKIRGRPYLLLECYGFSRDKKLAFEYARKVEKLAESHVFDVRPTNIGDFFFGVSQPSPHSTISGQLFTTSSEPLLMYGKALLGNNQYQYQYRNRNRNAKKKILELIVPKEKQKAEDFSEKGIKAAIGGGATTKSNNKRNAAASEHRREKGGGASSSTKVSSAPATQRIKKKQKMLLSKKARPETWYGVMSAPDGSFCVGKFEVPAGKDVSFDMFIRGRAVGKLTPHSQGGISHPIHDQIVVRNKRTGQLEEEMKSKTQQAQKDIKKAELQHAKSIVSESVSLKTLRYGMPILFYSQASGEIYSAKVIGWNALTVTIKYTDAICNSSSSSSSSSSSATRPRPVTLSQLRYIDFIPPKKNIHEYIRTNETQPGSYSAASNLRDEWEKNNAESATMIYKFNVFAQKKRAIRNESVQDIHDDLLALAKRIQQNKAALDSWWSKNLELLKETNTKINLLCLCCGVVPEIIALKKLGIKIGVVYVMDIDLDAVGVAVAQHPNIDFRTVKFGSCGNTPYKGLPGNVSELSALPDILEDINRDCGGISMVVTTSPCTSFSRAGNLDGFAAATGQVFVACAKIVKWYAEKGTTFYLGENVDSTVALNKKMNDSYDSNAVVMNGDDVSGMRRKRQIRTNFPPALDLTEELDGTKPHRQASTCIDADSAMHPDRKKVHCLLQSKQQSQCVYTQATPESDPKSRPFRIHELEKLMGHAVGFTKYTVGQAIMDRIKKHKVNVDGHIVHLKGAGTDPLEKQARELSDTERQKLLGNSVLPEMFAAALKPMVELFPAVSDA